MYKEKGLILQGVMSKKNVYCLEGGATKMYTEKKIRFLNLVGVLGNSNRGRIFWGPPKFLTS